MSHFSEWRFSENVRKYDFDSNDKYLNDLLNIDHSFTGRMDANIANTFILEASQLLVNSIAIFRLGYFDAAYYCLRESIEISTLMIYFVDLIDKDAKYKDWKNSDNKFPMQKQMLDYLKVNGDILKDMKYNMVNFFNSIDETSRKLNKFVHKQGLNKLYVSKNHPISLGANPIEKDEKTISEYESYLKKCIGIVAIMRLAIDPFPILLLEDEIYNRTNDLITDPYNRDFVSEYIGEDNLNDYKKTDLYINHYNSIMLEPLKDRALTDIIKAHYIDLEKMDIIIEQLDLLQFPYCIAAMLAIEFEKITIIYTYGGMMMFFTNRKTSRLKQSWNGADFKKFSDINKCNQTYDEAFISVLKVKKEYFYVEHNEMFTPKEISRLKNFEKDFNEKEDNDEK